jgi:hypothetical protein
MVVGMEIAQAHPLSGRHAAEIRVSGPSEIFRKLWEAIHSASKFHPVLLKFRRPGSASFLIDFCDRFETLWPSNRNPKAAPLQESARVRET